MIQGNERSEHAPSLHLVTGRIPYHIGLLRTEVTVGSVELCRFGLALLAMGLQTIVLFSPGHFRPSPTPLFAVLVPLMTLASLAISMVAGGPLHTLLTLRVRQTLAALTLCGLAGLSVAGAWNGASHVSAMVQGTPYGNDGAVMDLYAAQQLRHGHNPYQRTNIVKALAAINAPSTTTTPLMRGQFRGATAYPSIAAVQQVFAADLRFHVSTPSEFESKYNYPAGSFLFILPFVWAGLHDMRLLYILALAAMGAYIWKRAPRALRPLVPLLILADVPLVLLTTSGQPDPMYGLFLLLGLAELPSRRLSPLAMGVSAGTKQLAWFFVPIYLALVYRRYGLREALRRCGIMTGVFLLMNGPFIARSPHAFFSGIMGPLADPMFPLGIGVIALFVANVLPMVPKLLFTAVEVLTWAGASRLPLQLRRLPASAAVALGALPLFFAWRSLTNYFYLVPLLTIAVALAESQWARTRPVAR